MPLESGASVGPYTILAKLGEGGMGEVYRARDSKLKREVAIKVLPADVASDRERLARFQREAEVLAALNHPNIAMVFGIEDSALVMELVEGEDLAERVRRGPIPIDEALPIARQIADALEAAHEAGIIHRDLKPANIKVRPDGTVKVLDFGLAKALQDPKTPGPQDLSASPTITTPAMTMRGVILGTAAYMAPEQAKGKAVDKRADIWAFGCVLFEMLAGKRTFSGEDVTDIITSVMRDGPDWHALPAHTPPSIRTLLRRCLEKDARRRPPHIGIARMEIEDGMTGTGEMLAIAPPPKARLTRRELLAWGVAAALAITAAAVTLWPEPPAERLPAGRFTIDLPFTNVNPNTLVAVAPNGRHIAAIDPAAVAGAVGHTGIWLRDLAEEDFVKLPGSEGARTFAWSPDSRSIAYTTLNEIVVANVMDSSSRAIGRLSTEFGIVASMAWGAGGHLVVSLANGPLHLMPAAGGALTPLRPLHERERRQLNPVFFPDGRRFMYRSVRDSGDIAIIASADGDISEAAAFNDRLVWAGPTHVVYRRGNALLAQHATYDPLTLQGEPRALVADMGALSDLNTLQASRLNASASPATLLYRPDRVQLQQFTWVDRSGNNPTPVGPEGQYATFSLSADNTRIVTSRRERNFQHVWIMDATKGTLNRLTVGEASDVDPRFSPDGRSVIFGSTRDPRRSPFRVSIGGPPPERLFAFTGRMFSMDDWSRSGEWMVYHDASVPELRARKLDSSAEDIVVARTLTGIVDQASMSADGRWVAFYANESGRPEIFVVPFPPTGDRWQVSVEGGAQPLWRRDGRELFYLALDGTMMSVPIADAPQFSAGTPVRLFKSPLREVRLGTEQYAVAADGKRFLFTPIVGATTRDALTVITNWMSLLGPPGPPPGPPSGPR